MIYQGTGHGIGHFLSVHENPPTTSWSSKSEEPYEIGNYLMANFCKLIYNILFILRNDYKRWYFNTNIL